MVPRLSTRPSPLTKLTTVILEDAQHPVIIGKRWKRHLFHGGSHILIDRSCMLGASTYQRRALARLMVQQLKLEPPMKERGNDRTGNRAKQHQYDSVCNHAARLAFSMRNNGRSGSESEWKRRNIGVGFCSLDGHVQATCKSTVSTARMGRRDFILEQSTLLSQDATKAALLPLHAEWL